MYVPLTLKECIWVIKRVDTHGIGLTPDNCEADGLSSIRSERDCGGYR